MMDGIETASVRDHAALVETLAQAFQTDPALSWILPDPARRAHALRSLFDVLVPADMRAGVALRATHDESAALWRAPAQAHSGMFEFLRTVIPLVATFGTALPRGLKVQGSIDAHRPEGRFWYLHYVGVRREYQGKGHGGRIIRAQTAVADAEGLGLLAGDRHAGECAALRAAGLRDAGRMGCAGRRPSFLGYDATGTMRGGHDAGRVAVKAKAMSTPAAIASVAAHSP